jgi:rSAM/selenodomain-associated transferase 1
VTGAAPTWVVIAKAPVPGRVKTRLCPPCTPEQAADIAAAALRDTLDVVAAVPGRHVVALDGEPPTWLPSSFEVVAQRGDGLDERLAAVFADAQGPTLIVGMDTPQLTPELLGRVAAALAEDDVDAVLGPAEDGGYWLIAMADPNPEAVRGVPMSCDDTLVEQRRRLAELSLRVHETVSLRDVDHFDDALSVAAGAPRGRFARVVDGVAQSASASLSASSSTTGSPTPTGPGTTTSR